MSTVQQTEYLVQNQEGVVAAVSYVLDPYSDLIHKIGSGSQKLIRNIDI